MMKLQLTHYRNYTDTTVELARHTVICGPNGSGKTNIIEAIRTLSVTKSYRVTRDSDTIEWGQTYAALSLHQDGERLDYVLAREGQTIKKVMRHNGVPISLTQVYGLLPTVLFSPEFITLIDGPPQERRRFLDALLSQSDSTYIHTLLTYRKILKERHFLLLRLQQGLGQKDELQFWDQELAQSGEIMMDKRHAVIEALNKLIAERYPQFVVSGKPEILRLQYRPSTEPGQLLVRLKASHRYDIRTATTTVGPHRDEMVFMLRDRDVTLFASRGEMRRCILVTKLAEATYLETKTNKEPILLLDDVFSEFDAERRERILHSIQPYRSVITTTDATLVAETYVQDSHILTLPLAEGEKS